MEVEVETDKTATPAADGSDDSSSDEYENCGEDDGNHKGEQSKKVMGPCYEFTKEQEGELVEWFQQFPELYDKNHADYRKKNIRDKLMKAKADQYPD